MFDSWRRRVWTWALMGACCAAATFPGCIGTSGTPQDTHRPSAELRRTPLSELQTANISVNGHALRVWLALTSAQQEEGLMHVPPEEIADDQGMLFVFPDEQIRGFWMKNTITELDIAFARADGTIVATWRMPPLTLQTFPSIEPAMFALEMKAGAFQRLGISEGDRLEIPSDVVKQSP